MKKLVFLFTILISLNSSAQYNNMWIPDTMSGTTFNLTMKDTMAQIVATGQQTITGGINGKFWGPTLFVNKGDTIHMNVLNKLNDSTTLHWHGMHLPAVMDGGPHQIIPPNTLWQPYWQVKNNAALYWFHPHMHETTMDQITKGLGGLMIVRDAVESALPLPRKYGLDDIPLVLTDRDFNTSNQFTIVPYGDSMMTNMTLRAQYTAPAQVVRFRILDAAIERSFNIGLSDNSTFYVITSDGGLLNAPVPVTRYLLSPGERIEILVNLTGKTLGSSLDLKAYNSTLSGFIAGGENFVGGPFANFLGKKDFNILHINIGAQTASPITAIPTSLTTNTFPSQASANITRTITISDSSATNFPGVTILGPNAFLIERRMFKMDYNNNTVPLNNTEIWELKSTSIFAHPFHIHDVEFYILSRSTGTVPAAEQGWKDVVLVKGGETVKFIAKFDDFADTLHPFMYHCHIALHEDEGMMGQFIVKDTSKSVIYNCSGGTATGTATANTAVSGLSFSIPYSNATAGGAYTSQSINSTGVTGLTANLTAGTFSGATGNLTFNVAGTPSGSGTASFLINYGTSTCTYTINVNSAPSSVVYNCVGGSTTGSATANTAVSGLSFSIPFSSAISGNSYSSQVVNSTGVTGLTANLSAGTYSAATGNLTFNVSGTPTSSGAANFTLSYGTGATCTYAINVTAPTVGITNAENTSFSIYPNPAKDRLYLKMNQGREVYYITISDMVGRTKFMLPQPELEKGIDISNLAKGIYTMQVIEKTSYITSTQKFIVE